MTEQVVLEKAGPVARLWLNRPDKLNPLSPQVLESLIASANALAGDSEIRVLVIGGRGRCFSAGADLSGFPAPGSAAARRVADTGRRMADAIEALPMITIARLQGWCVGGGLVLAAACDLRVATQQTRFSIPEVALGIPLAWGGIPRLVREIGPALTKELVITCRPFDADEALRAGFLNRVVDEERLDESVDELVASIVEKPAFPAQATKRHVDAVTANQIGLSRSWSDADSLLSGLLDPECAAARENYLKSKGAS